MRIAVQVLAYNVSRFIKSAIANMAPFVDRIYVAHSRRPYGYLPESRLTKTNQTTIEELRCVNIDDKVAIIEGDWLDEESMRNACLDRAKADGFDWMLIQDADEFYTESSWRQVKDTLLRSPQAELFVTTWYNFWKSSHYVLENSKGEIKGTNAGFALRCRPDLRFIDRRSTNAADCRVIDSPCYHYGYVMSDAEMLEKIATWSHSHEFDSRRWYHLKWENWNPSTRYLHPTYPVEWRRAMRFPLPQPDFASEFALPVKPAIELPLGDILQDTMFDGAAILRHAARGAKRMLLAGLHRR